MMKSATVAAMKIPAATKNKQMGSRQKSADLTSSLGGERKEPMPPTISAFLKAMEPPRVVKRTAPKDDSLIE